MFLGCNWSRLLLLLKNLGRYRLRLHYHYGDLYYGSLYYHYRDLYRDLHYRDHYHRDSRDGDGRRSNRPTKRARQIEQVRHLLMSGERICHDILQVLEVRI